MIRPISSGFLGLLSRSTVSRATRRALPLIVSLTVSLIVSLGMPLASDSHPFVTLARGAELRGTIVDARTNSPLAARVYLRDEAGEWHFVESASEEGSALAYREQWVPMPHAVERHTTVSAHPFRVELPPGTYEIEIERGKEYRALRQTVRIDATPRSLTFRLERWADAAARGWYSGETHVHRRLHELPNVMLAEDLNVAFPVTFWTIRSDQAPDLSPSPLRSQGPSPFGPREDRGTEPIQIDSRHVIVPRNTEYEIFSIGDRRHTLGAVFILNHRSRFTETAPPVAPIAEKAHREGALLDLDKHSWPWAVMLAPVAKIDLFELSNNSVWRTRFGFNQLPEPIPEWMNVERDSPTTLSEWGWLQYGWECWYAMLSCGLRLAPSAGTASGVHPVPLGHSRVYVHTGDDFSLERWLDGLKAGRSFVTTGPQLYATLNDALPGTDFTMNSSHPQRYQLKVESLSERPISHLEVVVDGQVARQLPVEAELTMSGAYRIHGQFELEPRQSSWLAVRSIEPQPDGRRRFAHTGVWRITVDNQPLRPRNEQVDYLLERVEREILRNRELLALESMEEFEQAREFYRQAKHRAR